MGILVCLNGQPLKKFLNADLGLTTNSTLGQLKDNLLAQAPELARLRTYFCGTNLGRDINNVIASTTGLTSRRESSFRITNMYFGVPYSCDNIWQLNRNSNLDEGRSLIDIYRDYQYDASFAVDEIRSTILSDVYNRYIYRWRREYEDDPGQITTDYFVNINNPDIPTFFRPVGAEMNPKATRHSLAWLVVNIECNTLRRRVGDNTGLVTSNLQGNPGGGGQEPLAGGKTRNRRRNYKKSIRKGSNKNKRTIRRRIKANKSVRKHR
jgi:hypothetical protein